jgi:predicted phosphodiesterase
MLGLVADVNANAVALDTVLRELDAESIDEVVCLGDVAAPGPQPRAVLDTLRERDIQLVSGRGDASLIADGGSGEGDGPGVAPDLDPEIDDLTRLGEIRAWCRERLREPDRQFLREAAGSTDVVTDGGVSVTCLHGEEGSRLPDLTPETPADDLTELLSLTESTVVVGGQTHEPMARRFGERMVVNSGSVGRPYEYRADGDISLPWAEYAVVSGSTEGLRVEFRRTPVDQAAVAEAVHSSGMPHGDWWLTDGGGV